MAGRDGWRCKLKNRVRTHMGQQQESRRYGSRYGHATAAMVAILAGGVGLHLLPSAIGAAIVSVTRRLFDCITNVTHATHAGLHSRHGDDQGKYENKVLHAFVSKMFDSVTATHDKGSIR